MHARRRSVPSKPPRLQHPRRVRSRARQGPGTTPADEEQLHVRSRPRPTSFGSAPRPRQNLGRRDLAPYVRTHDPRLARVRSARGATGLRGKVRPAGGAQTACSTRT